MTTDEREAKIVKFLSDKEHSISAASSQIAESISELARNIGNLADGLVKLVDAHTQNQLINNNCVLAKLDTIHNLIKNLLPDYINN